jgi:hypothetical protein
MIVELIPSAKRLIRSLRDIGYEFVDAVADIVDNSVEAQATVVSINLKFEGEDSYLTIADNGTGMTSKEIQEALRFGSNRAYGDLDDLGRYGLGLKTASLSQCERLTVSARRGEERARINSYCWDLDHIEKTNRWEILKIDREELKQEVWNHMHETTGTVVTWERLGRLLGYKYPSGEHARKQAELMAESLKIHLGMVFHRFLSGDIYGKRIAIYINDERVVPWDPYSRGEKHTQEIDPIYIPLVFNEGSYKVKIQPYILPPQWLYSSTKAHLNASGPGKWNKQQGLYIYRSNRIIQAGGWSGLRTSDEHTKLARIAVFIPSQLDELFQVNVAKKHLSLPREFRATLLKEIQPIVTRAQEIYRDKLTQIPGLGGDVLGADPSEKNGLSISTLSNVQTNSTEATFLRNDLLKANNLQIDRLVTRAIRKAGISDEEKKFSSLMNGFFDLADGEDKQVLIKLLRKYLIVN